MPEASSVDPGGPPRSRGARAVVYRPEHTNVWPIAAVLALVGMSWFMAHRPQSLDSDHDMAFHSYFLALLLGPFFIWEWSRRVMVTREDGMLHVTHLRYPFARRTVSYAVREVRDVAIEVDPMGEPGVWRLILLLHDGTRAPIYKHFSGKGKHHERTAMEIRALLDPPQPDGPIARLDVPWP